MKGDPEMLALVVAVDGDDEFSIDLGILVGKWNAKREQAIRDREAAQLLPAYGAENVAERQKCHRSTVYRRVSRAAKVARQMLTAT